MVVYMQARIFVGAYKQPESFATYKRRLEYLRWLVIPTTQCMLLTFLLMENLVLPQKIRNVRLTRNACQRCLWKGQSGMSLYTRLWQLILTSLVCRPNLAWNESTSALLTLMHNGFH